MGPPLRVLVVCTANQCRSPMAEVLLRRALAEVGFPARVASAGVFARDGVAATSDAVAAMAARGLDLGGHRSQRVRPSGLASAGLVLCMERQHLPPLGAADAVRFAHTFTLPEIVARAAVVGGRRPDEPVTAWLARAHEGRCAADVVGGPPELDVADPIGLGPARYEETAAQLDGLCRALAVALTGGG